MNSILKTCYEVLDKEIKRRWSDEEIIQVETELINVNL